MIRFAAHSMLPSCSNLLIECTVKVAFDECWPSRLRVDLYLASPQLVVITTMLHPLHV